MFLILRVDGLISLIDERFIILSSLDYGACNRAESL